MRRADTEKLDNLAPRRARTLVAASALAVAALLAHCSSDVEKGPEEPVSGGGTGGETGGAKDEGAATASASRITLVTSLSNNPLTSQTISPQKAEALAERFQSSKDRNGLEARVASERLARKPVQQVLASARKLAELEMEKGAGRSIGDETKLEVALAAINSKNFALADYYLQSLVESKNARLRAGAYNALGVIALRDDRVPEAVLYFRESLKAISNYRPAMLNLGFAALKGGDLKVAREKLSDLQNDWFVQYGLLSIARLEGNEGRAGELCDKVLEKEPSHKAALFNCGLFEAQNKKNYKKAHELIGRAAKAKGGEGGWDEKIQSYDTQIDQEEAEAKKSNKKPAVGPPAPAKPGGAP